MLSMNNYRVAWVPESCIQLLLHSLHFPLSGLKYVGNVSELFFKELHALIPQEPGKMLIENIGRMEW